MTRLRQRGFTLIELIIFIVVVGVGLAGILTVVNTVVKSSADPMVRKQAAALADSVLEEILLKAYCDPVNATVDSTTHLVTACGTNTAKASRADYNNVDDYNGKGNAAFTDLPTNLSAAYAIGIAVANGSATLGVTAKKVTVTVTGGSETIVVSGYRANY